ncbi:hypothetical protein ACFLQJ_03170, partial [Calditrichota bacterium]
MKKFTIRGTQPEDLSGVGRLSLLRGEDPEIKTEEQYIQWWNWLYKDNPHGITNSLTGVDEVGNVQGHIGFVPYLYRIYDKKYLIGFIIQLMVSEEYNHTLLFPSIEIKLLKEYTKYGLNFANGLVNRPHIIKAHCAIGYKETGRIPVYVRPYCLEKLVEGYVPTKRIIVGFGRLAAPITNFILSLDLYSETKNVDISRIVEFNDDFDVFNDKMKQYFPVTCERTTKILNWRYSAPNRKYYLFAAHVKGVLVGYMAVRRMGMRGFDVLTIVDLMFSPERKDIGRMLLHQAHRIALKMKVDMSVIIQNPSSPILPVIKRSGFIRTPQTFAWLLHTPKNSSGELLNTPFEKWYNSWFDHDYV